VAKKQSNGERFGGYGVGYLGSNLNVSWRPESIPGFLDETKKEKTKKERLKEAKTKTSKADAKNLANQFEYDFTNPNINQTIFPGGATSDQTPKKTPGRSNVDKFINDLGGYQAYGGDGIGQGVNTANQVYGVGGGMNKTKGTKDDPLLINNAYRYGDYDDFSPDMNPNLMTPGLKRSKQPALRAINQARKENLGTLAQMAPVYAKAPGGDPIMIQGKNFANPDFSLMNPGMGVDQTVRYKPKNKKLDQQTMLDRAGPGFIVRDKVGRTVKSAIPKVLADLKAGSGGKWTPTQLVAALQGKSEADVAASKAASSARLKKVSTARAQSQYNAIKNSKSLSQANSILAQLGRNIRLEPQIQQRRRGRYRTRVVAVWTGPNQSYTKRYRHSTGSGRGKMVSRRIGNWPGKIVSYGASPEGVINEYYEKTGLVDWYKSLDPETRDIEKVNKLSGLQSTYAYYDRIMDKAKERKKRYDKISAEPLGEAAVYAAIPESRITELEEYRGTLEEGSKTLQSDIDVLREAVTKLEIQTGKSLPEARKKLMTYQQNVPTLEKSLASARNPFDIASTQFGGELSGLKSDLKERQSRYNIREGLREDLESAGLIKAGQPINVQDAKTQLETRQGPLDARVASLQKQYDDVSNQNVSGRSNLAYKYRRMASLRKSIQSAKSAASKNKTLVSTIDKYGGDQGMFTGGMIGESLVGNLGNIGLQTRGSKKYGRWKSGTTRIKIPKEYIKDGKVTLEADIQLMTRKSWGKANITGFGDVNAGMFNPYRGDVVRNNKKRAEFAVDSDGYVTLNAKTVGNKYGSNISISNIQVYDPTLSGQLYGDITNLQTNISAKSAELAQANRERNIYSSAQAFLGGQSGAFQIDGKKVAEVQDGQFKLYDQDSFKKYLGDASGDIFTSTAIIAPTVRQLDTKLSGLQTTSESYQTQKDTLNQAKNFITGAQSTITVGDKVIARRTQQGTIRVEDKAEWDKLGINVPKDFKFTDTTYGYKIQDLEKEIETKQATIESLQAELTPLAQSQMSRTTAATINHYKALKRAGLISPGDYTRAVKEIKAGNTDALKKITSGQYIPNILDLDSDAEDDATQIAKESKQIIKELKRKQATGQAYGGGTTKPKTPTGSPVGAVLRRGSLGRGYGPSNLARSVMGRR